MRVQGDKKTRPKKLKSKIHGVAVDEDTGLLIEAGSRLHGGNISKFLRAAIHKYFEKKK